MCYQLQKLLLDTLRKIATTPETDCEILKAYAVECLDLADAMMREPILFEEEPNE